MRFIGSLLLFLTIISVQSTIAQMDELEQWIESIMADLEEEGDFDLNTVLEAIEFYAEHPFNLNEADETILRELVFLNSLDINAILEHRRLHGDFLNVLELQSVPGLSIEKIRLLKNLSRAAPPVSFNVLNPGRLLDKRHEFYLKWRRTLETQKGYTEEANSPFLGDPNRLYARYKFTAGSKIQFGFTAEKDPGEPFLNGVNKYGFDFYSAHLKIDNPVKYVNRIVLGDFALNLGQGLISYMGFGANKSTQVTRLKLNSNTFRPFTSVSEYNFMRGVAIDFRLSENIDLKVFASYRNRDSNIEVDTFDQFILVTSYTSLPLDGFHRTAREAEKKGALGLRDIGASLQMDFGKLDLNLNLLQSQFTEGFDQQQQFYQRFSGLEEKNLNGSIDYSYINRNLNIFGEAAMDNDGDLAITTGALVGLDRKLDVGLLYRNFSRGYQSLYADGVSENTRPQNEKGLYISSIYRFNKNWTLFGFADFFSFPWLKFRVDSPSEGHEYFFKLQHVQKRKSKVYVQYFYEQKEINSSISESLTKKIVPTFRHRLRIHGNYVFNENIELRNRIEFSRFQKEGNQSFGIMAYQDIIYKSSEFPLSATFRYALFDTDDYDSRIYAYENDLLYEFSIPSFSNRGFRTYLNLRYRINRNLTAEFRASRSYFNDRESIGTSNTLINDNTRTDLKAQLRFKF